MAVIKLPFALGRNGATPVTMADNIDIEVDGEVKNLGDVVRDGGGGGQGGNTSANKVSFDNTGTSLGAENVQDALDELDAKKVDSEQPEVAPEGDPWSMAVAELSNKAHKRIVGEPRPATENDYYDDPLGVDSIIEGDHILEVDENTPDVVVTWADPAHTLHVYMPDEPNMHKVTIIRKNNGKVCVENYAFIRSNNTSNIGTNAIYEIQDSILKVENLEAV